MGHISERALRRMGEGLHRAREARDLCKVGARGEGTRMKNGSHRRGARFRIGRWLERVSRAVTDWSGSSWAFGIAALVIIVWLVTGPIFRFSDTWQLVINT